MLRLDLSAAGIAHERDGAVIDFHSFRCYRVTQAIMSGRSSRVVMETVRLSSEALFARVTPKFHRRRLLILSRPCRCLSCR